MDKRVYASRHGGTKKALAPSAQTKDRSQNYMDSSDNQYPNKCTLHVCKSCRPTGFPGEPRNQRPGFLLHEKLERLIEDRNLGETVTLQAADCLSLCPRPCGVALSAPGHWTYLFGDQDSEETANNILDCALVYLAEPKGEMPRAKRPASLRSSIMGRIPPSFNG